MKAFAATFGPLLEKSMPAVPQRKDPFNTSWPYTDATAFQRCVAKEMRATQSTDNGMPTDLPEQDILQLLQRRRRNEDK